jgi:hypothetical protein
MSYSLELVIGYLVCGVVGLFALLILWLVLKGEINLDLLISEKTGEASMSRFQLLIFTFVIGLSFFLIVVSSAGLHSGAAGQAPANPVLPNVPGGVLALLGISASSYTVSKAIQMANKPAGGNPPAPANPPAPQNQPGPAGQAG